MTHRLLVFLAWGLIMTLGSSGVHAAEHPRGPSASPSPAPALKSPPAAADFAVAKTCVFCLQAEVDSLGNNPHAKQALERSSEFSAVDRWIQERA